MPNYGDPKYWDQRYKKQKDTYFDWLENYESLKPLMNNLFDRHDKILNVGCGNAQLTEDMYDDGYTSIINTDISSVVIEQMRERNLHRQGMLWEVDDVLDMKYEDESFDVIIDKSSLASRRHHRRHPLRKALLPQRCHHADGNSEGAQTRRPLPRDFLRQSQHAHAPSGRHQLTRNEDTSALRSSVWS